MAAPDAKTGVSPPPSRDKRKGSSGGEAINFIQCGGTGFLKELRCLRHVMVCKSANGKGGNTSVPFLQLL